ncbi:hypothetical protein T4C_10278 [Trichinella pseudospiralis]|uniref:Uncharacterized protein n=1 Tax=Trichinella pseudospiralis TaxID=6337 RepID=A0A0V1IRA7_TRIPS|nr:hypothetical protein T4C_10278 [Trichinella pseudospiralis]
MQMNSTRKGDCDQLYDGMSVVLTKFNESVQGGLVCQIFKLAFSKEQHKKKRRWRTMKKRGRLFKEVAFLFGLTITQRFELKYLCNNAAFSLKCSQSMQKTNTICTL